MRGVEIDVAPQADGRQWVTYTFTTDVGDIIAQQTLQAGDVDPGADVPALAALIEQSLKGAEAVGNAALILAGREADCVFKYSALDDAHQAVRAQSADILAMAQAAANVAVAAASVDPTLAPVVRAAAVAVQEQMS